MCKSAAAVAACVVAVLALPAPAAAATAVSVTEEPAGGAVRTFVTIRGDDGPNRVGFARELGAVVVRDLAGVVAGVGCSAIEGDAGTAARCPVTARASVIGRVEGGGGDDLLALAGLLDYGTVDGGPGDDLVEGDGELLGGEGADILRGGLDGDLLDGGPGADIIDGGGERSAALDLDYVDYRRRTAGVRVDLAGGGDAGEAGEGDRLEGVEGVLGGAGDDVMTGSPEDDVLDGGAGDDRLSGGDGDDWLRDGQDAAVLEGGPGDDRLQTTPAPLPLPGEAEVTQPPRVAAGRGELRGGPGRDRLTSGPAADLLDPGPGEDTITAGGGPAPDAIDLRDGAFDALRCLGAARVRADGRDLAARCRAVRRTAPARPWLVSVRGGEPTVATVACAGAPRRCTGTLRVTAGGRTVGTRRYSVRPGTAKRLRLELDPRGVRRVAVALTGRDAEGRAVRQRRAFRL